MKRDVTIADLILLGTNLFLIADCLMPFGRPFYSERIALLWFAHVFVAIALFGVFVLIYIIQKASYLLDGGMNDVRCE